jgi:hypothetical protein
MVELTRHGGAREVEKCENVSGGRSFQPNGESMEAEKPRSQRLAASLKEGLLVPSSIFCVAHLGIKPSTRNHSARSEGSRRM